MRRGALVLLGALTIGGCVGPRSSVVFLDGENGAPAGAVAVLDAGGHDRAVIDRADTLVRLTPHGARQRAILRERAETKDGALIQELPKAAGSYRFLYASDDDDFLPSSADALAGVLADTKLRGDGYDIQIVGHTDRAGTMDYNDKLGLDRARRLYDRLAKAGLRTDVIRVSSRGERDATGPEGAHDNDDRYVEVLVR